MLEIATQDLETTLEVLRKMHRLHEKHNDAIDLDATKRIIDTLTYYLYGYVR